MHPTKNPAARAANVTYVMLQYRRDLDREELNPVCCGELSYSRIILHHWSRID